MADELKTPPSHFDSLTKKVHLNAYSITLPSEENLNRRFHLVTGKGGVGKSTISMALGMAFSQRGWRTLICEIDHREMMTQAFQVPPSQSEVRSLDDYLSVVSIDTQSALSEYGALKLKLKALSTLLTENPLTRALVSIVPGSADLIALGKAFNHERERDRRGYVWDRIIVDAPSTGHGLTFMRLPQVIRDVVPSGNIRGEADEMWALLSDQTRTLIHVVTVPEELPTQETLELWRALEDDVGLSPQVLWVNMCESPPFTDRSWTAIQQLRTSDPPQTAHMNPRDPLSYLEQRQGVIKSQYQHLAKLASIKADHAVCPRLRADEPFVLRASIEQALNPEGSQ